MQSKQAKGGESRQMSDVERRERRMRRTESSRGSLEELRKTSNRQRN